MPENAASVDHAAVEREAHLMLVISAIIRAYDHPPDATAYTRLHDALRDARLVLHESCPCMDCRDDR